ncbi:MAG: response regulator, partial [Pseudolabrys sp.]
VHGFAEQSGGAFVLHSQKGRGTTAEIWLPAAKDSTQTGTRRLAQSGPVKTQRSRTILAVDDDALVLMNTVAMLEDLGHSVFEAYSGKEALELMRQEESIDLVITDQAMPQMSGTQLAKIIRQEWPNVSILLDRLFRSCSRRRHRFAQASEAFSAGRSCSRNCAP